MRLQLAATLVLLDLWFAGTALGQVGQLGPSPPKMLACSNAEHPRLPEKWRATYLMAPFTSAQLVLAEIEHDGDLSATRAKLHGLKRGSLDLLVLGTHTYWLGADQQEVSRCHDLGDTGWRPLRRDWLATTARCVGSAPVGDVEVDWWQMPAGRAHLANWVWFKTSDQTPFRVMLVRASNEFGPLGSFALSHQVRFEALQESTLASDVAICRGDATSELPDGQAAVRRMIAAMSQAPERDDAALKELMPEINDTCGATALRPWPDTFAATGFMTSLDLRHTTFPAQIFYDWHRKALRTRLYLHSSPPSPSDDVLLIGPTGYGITHGNRSRLSCTGPQPGVLRSDWQVTGTCSCEAEIGATTPLTPYGPARILRCPATEPRVFWTWYTHEGRPMLFAETASGDEKGAMLTLVDYHRWLPGFESPASALTKPAQCIGEPPYSRQTPDGKVCVSCHLGGPRQR
jgi:hypothetical protein